MRNEEKRYKERRLDFCFLFVSAKISPMSVKEFVLPQTSCHLEKFPKASKAILKKLNIRCCFDVTNENIILWNLTQSPPSCSRHFLSAVVFMIISNVHRALQFSTEYYCFNIGTRQTTFLFNNGRQRSNYSRLHFMHAFSKTVYCKFGRNNFNIEPQTFELATFTMKDTKWY